MKKICLLICCCIIFLAPVQAAFDQQHGARSVAMGSAYTAVCDDLSAINWNPAGLAKINGPSFSCAGADLMNLGFNYTYFAFGCKMGNSGLGISLSMADDSVFPFKEKTMTLAIARPIAFLQVGAAFNLYQMDTIEKGQGVGLDLGIKASKQLQSGNLDLGVMIHNAYSKLDFTTDFSEGLNQYLSAGIAYQYRKRALFALDIHDKELSMGCEYYLVDNLATRVGWNNGEVTAGFSVGVGRWTIDYAYLMRALGNENRISLNRKF